MEQQEILKALRDDIQAAKQRAKTADDEFNATVRDFPSGLPHSDGIHRLQSAGLNLRHAQEQFLNACMRLNDFLISGVVPENLRKDDRKG
jgi:hypothetical protein